MSQSECFLYESILGITQASSFFQTLSASSPSAKENKNIECE